MPTFCAAFEGPDTLRGRALLTRQKLDQKHVVGGFAPLLGPLASLAECLFYVEASLDTRKNCQFMVAG